MSLTRREAKLPKLLKGMHFTMFEMLYMCAASTRGKTQDALKGTSYDSLPPDGICTTDEQREAMEENNRALNELMSCMPDIRLMGMVMDSASIRAPQGCAMTAWNNIKEEMDEISTADKER
jgi:hypothetical protein